jgi:hypothetical protein
MSIVLNRFVWSGGHSGSAEQSSPDQNVEDPGPRKAIDFNEQGDDTVAVEANYLLSYG